jgi:hypothetical protein
VRFDGIAEFEAATGFSGDGFFAKRTGQQDDRYADYIVHEQTGKRLAS